MHAIRTKTEKWQSFLEWPHQQLRTFLIGINAQASSATPKRPGRPQKKWTITQFFLCQEKKIFAGSKQVT